MKKLSLLLLFAFGLFIVSCGGEEADTEENNTEVADHECCSEDCPEDCAMHAEEKEKCEKDCKKKCDKSKCDKSKCEGKCDGECKKKCKKSCDKDSTDSEMACEEGGCMPGACAGAESE